MAPRLRGRSAAAFVIVLRTHETTSINVHINSQPHPAFALPIMSRKFTSEPWQKRPSPKSEPLNAHPKLLFSAPYSPPGSPDQSLRPTSRSRQSPASLSRWEKVNNSYASGISDLPLVCGDSTPPANVRSFAQLCHYFSTSTLLTVLHDAPPLFFKLPANSPVIPPPILSRQYNSLRLDFSPHTNLLRIWMPTPIHESIQFFASEMQGTIPSRPGNPLLGTSASVQLPTALYVHDDHNSAYQPPPTTTLKRKVPTSGSGSSSGRAKRKKAAIMKTPDYAYMPRDSEYPTVVFEVGWTEDPVDLNSDAEQWLVKTSGQVQVVITVRFIECNSPLSERSREVKWLISQPAAVDTATAEENLGFVGVLKESAGVVEEGMDREKIEKEWRGYLKPVAWGGNEADGGSNSDEALSPAPSSVSDHMLQREEIDPNQWVGEIWTKVKFSRYSKVTGQMYTDGVEYVLSPDGTVSPTSAPQPTLSMRDVWGASLGEGEDGAQTACTWDWKSFKRYVERARRNYAFIRKKDLAGRIWSD